MATAAQRAMFGRATTSETKGGAVPTDARQEPPQTQLGESAAPEVAIQYQSFRSLVDRAVEVFGDDLTASRWLSMPSADLDGKVPLHIAQSLQYDEQRMRSVFEPIFIQIEHGIYV